MVGTREYPPTQTTCLSSLLRGGLRDARTPLSDWPVCFETEPVRCSASSGSSEAREFWKVGLVRNSSTISLMRLLYGWSSDVQIMSVGTPHRE